MSKISGLTLEQALEFLRNEDNKMLYTDRTGGRINPLSMRIMTFKEAFDIARLKKWSWTWEGVTKENFSLSWKGFYVMNEDGTFTNVNRVIVRLVKAGLLREGKEGFITI